jgi:hypothetical protein
MKRIMLLTLLAFAVIEGSVAQVNLTESEGRSRCF